MNLHPFRRKGDLPPASPHSDFDGLPAGLEPPPVPALVDVDWLKDVSENARNALPHPGYPSRPLPFEDSVLSTFGGDMRALTKWGQRQRGLLPTLHVVATERCAELEQRQGRIARERDELQDELIVLRDQLTDRDLRFMRNTGKMTAAMAGALTVAAALETTALQPVIGQVAAISNERAWGLTIFAVASLGVGARLLGSSVHRALAYEGPRRLRRGPQALSILLAVGNIAVLGAIVGLRVATRRSDITGVGTAFLTGLLYAAVQAFAQGAAVAHGWWHSNPRVLEVANTEGRVDDLERDLAVLSDELDAAKLWQDSLQEFQLNEWLTEHRGQIAEDYAAADFRYRNDLGQALTELGHDDSAAVLMILPAPKFVPPIEVNPDDDADWLQGFMLPL